MDEIFNFIMRGVVRLSIWIGTLLGAGLQHIILWFMHRSGERAPAPIPQAQKDENAQLAGCRDVVLSIAKRMGFIAREAISREELEQLIDNGISPDALREEIYARIMAYPGIVIGRNSYTDDDIKLPYSLRTRHAYLIGRSGSGKTTAIQNMVFQDIAYGCGVGVLAPEQELITEEILPFIPEERMDDVVYVNPADLEYPIPLNPLHLGKWEDIDRTVDDLITVFGRLTNDLTPRMREILYHTFYALVEREGSTLLDVEILLDRNDPSIRNEIIYTTKNPRTSRFFQSVFPTLSRDACLPIYSRIGQIISPQRVRSLLCQPGRSFNFREAMDDGKILLFNLSDGILGEQTSQMLGQLIVSKIQMAVFSRADTPARQRRPFFLYLDEFQTFTGTSQTAYSKLLSRGRKYSFGTVLANQNTGQLPSALLEDILGNVSTLIAFNLSSNDAAKFSKEFVMPGGGETLRLPQDFLLQLRVGEAWGKIGQTVFPLKTQLLTQPANPIRAKEIIERSRMNYGGKVSREEWLMRIEESMPIDLERGQDFIVIEDDDDDDDVDPGQIF